jgi:hypothetical protein
MQPILVNLMKKRPKRRSKKISSGSERVKEASHHQKILFRDS